GSRKKIGGELLESSSCILGRLPRWRSPWCKAPQPGCGISFANAARFFQYGKCQAAHQPRFKPRTLVIAEFGSKVIDDQVAVVTSVISSDEGRAGQAARV